MLELRNISASYGPVRVLYDVDLRVEAGTLVALLGRNGAGKTTTLRVATGLLPAQRGTVALDGRALNGSQPEDLARLGLAHVPEGRGIFPRFTVKENLEIGGHTHRVARRRLHARIEEVLDWFPPLRDRLAQQGGNLSGGEQQMLAVARALMSHPRLLLVDEPSLGLAPIVIDGLYELFARLKGEGMTILLVEQYVERALEVADHAYVLEKGRIVVDGPAAALTEDQRLVEAYFAG